MDNISEVMKATGIGLVIAIFLVNTCRGTKAIKLLKECLVLLNNAAINNGMNHHIVLEAVKFGYRVMVSNTYKKVAYMSYDQSKYATAIELTMEALAIDIKIGNKNGEAAGYENLGACFQYVGQYDKAKEYHEKALAMAIELSDRNVEAVIYGNLGNVYRALGEYDKAKIYHEKALAIKIEIGDKKGEANDYGNLGTVFLSLAEYFKAEKYLEKALEIRMQIGDRKGEASSYVNLGAVFFHLSKNVKAIEYFEKAILIQIEIGDRYGEATSYGNLGNVFEAVGEYAKAKEYQAKALVIAKEINDKSGEAGYLRNLGDMFYSIDDYAKAKQHYEKALSISMEIGDREAEASSYGNLGTVFKSLGEHVKAKEYFEKALTIRKEIGNRLGEAADYGNLGALFFCLGKYVKAHEYQEKALAISKEIGDRKGEADTYNNLGALFSSLGEYAKAKEYCEKELTIRKEIGDRKGEATVYGNLGTMFQFCNTVRAKEYYEKSFGISKEIGDRKGEAGSREKLGTMFLFLGEHVKAQEYYEKSLSIYKEIGYRAGEASIYGALGNVCRVRGEYKPAEEYLEKALIIFKDIGDHKDEFLYYCSLASVKLSQRKFLEAFSYLFQSIKMCEDLRCFLADNDQFKISFSDAHVLPYQTLSYLFCVAGKPNEALYVVELGRARALADLMTTQYSVKTQISANPESWIGMENITKKQRNCTCLYISYNHQHIFLWILKASEGIHFQQINVNEQIVHDARIKDLNDFFSKRLRSFGILSEEECEDRYLHDTQSNLKSSREESPADMRLVENDDGESQEPEPSLSLYYKMFIAPVADLLKAREIIIVPDRALYQVPFAALPDESGKYLSETFRIRIVPSLTTLKLIQDSPADYHSQTGALIVGDPDVGQVLYKGRLEGLSRLPCAGKEAEMIGRLLGVQPLLAEHATKQAVLQRIHSVGLIHFAAHGNAERGEIALAPHGTSNRIPEEEDYLLTMSDISQVQLRAKLVVLSCCHSASGQIRTEGVVGIARAFLGSGARSVLVALWAIEDTATEQFMCRFYEHLVRGESASESLHEAMKWMRGNGFSDVSQWAPFMLIGDNVTLAFGKK